MVGCKRQLITSICLLFAALTLFTCGKKKATNPLDASGVSPWRGDLRGTLAQNSGHLSWTRCSHSGGTGDHLYRRETAIAQFDMLKLVGNTDSLYNDLSAMPGQTYIYALRAVVSGGEENGLFVSDSIRIPRPQMVINRDSLIFAMVQDGAVLPVQDSFRVINIGSWLLDWSLTDNATWLNQDVNASRSNSQLVWVTVVGSGLGVGNHQALITIKDTSAISSPRVLPVRFTITEKPIYHTLSVVSRNPDSGVLVIASVADSQGVLSGLTPLTLKYMANQNIRLSVPAIESGKPFYRWVKSNTDTVALNPLDIAMTGDISLTAIYGTPPTAAFTQDKTCGKLPFTVNFTDQSTGDISGWQWDFGDGNTSDTRHPAHPYSTPGPHTVQLIVSGIAGTASITKPNLITGARLLTSPQDWSVGAEKDTLIVDISSDCHGTSFNWTATSGSSWLHIIPTSDTCSGNLSLIADSNLAPDQRVGRVEINAIGLIQSPDTVVVTQAGMPLQPKLVLSADSIRLSGLGGTSSPISITLENSTLPSPYAISVGVPWLTVSKTNGTTPDVFTVTAKENFGVTDRVGWVSVQASLVPGPPETLYVGQPKLQWSSLGTGLNGEVEALCVFGNSLIAGGYFSLAGGNNVRNIARWDGSNWYPLGNGLNNIVYSITSDWSFLVAGGGFDTAGNVVARGIAGWNALDWSPIGSITGGVWAITNYKNKLIVGGNYINGMGGIAAWDGMNWSSLGSGTNSDVSCLAVFGDQLIAGGRFTSAGGQACNYIASWNGTAWSTLGPGLGRWPDVLTVFDNKLVAGSGLFQDFPAFITQWDGSSWSWLVTSLNGPVYAFTVFNGKLVAGGHFTNINGSAAAYVAILDGDTWLPLGTGTFGPVHALTVFNGRLIAAGDFNYGDYHFIAAFGE